MADFISDLASKSGVSTDLAKKGVGALLAFLKGHLPAEGFARIEAAVPGADGMTAAAQADEGKPSGGGILGAVTGLAGKLFGGGGGAALLTQLTQLGFSADQVQSFLPKVLEFFKDKLPGDLMKQVSGLIPAGEKVGS
jgi:hypothetical protein